MLKEDLIEYRALRQEVRQQHEQRKDMEARMYSPRGQRFSSTPNATHGKGHTMDDVVCKHVELLDMIAANEAELTCKIVSLEKAVEGLESSIERQVLRLRYFEALSWQKISQIVGYSEPRLYEIQRSALRHLKEFESLRA